MGVAAVRQIHSRISGSLAGVRLCRLAERRGAALGSCTLAGREQIPGLEMSSLGPHRRDRRPRWVIGC